MKIDVKELKKCYSNNHFAMCYMPVDSGKSTFYFHEKGIVGISFIDDIFGNKIMLQFVKNNIRYSTRIKEFKSKRSLALLISKFHLSIDLMQNKK